VGDRRLSRSERRYGEPKLGTPKTIVSLPGNQLAAPQSAAVNAHGHAVVIFSAFNNTFSNHTEYASND